MSISRIAILKTGSINEFVRIWSIAAAVFLVILVGLLIVAIIPV